MYVGRSGVRCRDVDDWKQWLPVPLGALNDSGIRGENVVEVCNVGVVEVHTQPSPPFSGEYGSVLFDEYWGFVTWDVLALGGLCRERR
jgi:hypothetical protein